METVNKLLRQCESRRPLLRPQTRSLMLSEQSSLRYARCVHMIIQSDTHVDETLVTNVTSVEAGDE